MTARLAREWVSLKRQNRYASINHLNPATFAVNWEWCVLVRSAFDGGAPTKDALEFEFVGRRFHEDAPSCVAATRLSSVPARSRLHLATDFLPHMFEQRTAILFQGTLDWGHAGAIRFRSIALPFADSAGSLKYAFGAFSHLLATDPPGPPAGTAELRAFRDGTWHPLEAVRS